MKIASHNVEFLFDEGTYSHSGQDWIYSKEFVESRIEHFAKLFAEIDADIVLLQEVGSKSVIEKIIERSGIKYFYFLATPDQFGVGNAVLYKDETVVCSSIPAVSAMPVFVEGDTDTIGPRIWSRRDFVHVETELNGKKIDLLGIHIKANFLMGEKNEAGESSPLETQLEKADGLIRSELFRFSQAKKLRGVVCGLLSGNPDTFVVVGGDFNAEENSSIFRIIQGVNLEAADALVQVSKNLPEDHRFSACAKDKKGLIDHILISKNLQDSLMNVQILNKNLSYHKNIAPSELSVVSDHAPVVIEIK